MFIPGRKYKHQNFLEVVMLVNGVAVHGPGYFTLKVTWLCRGLNLGSEQVKVRNLDDARWSEV